MRVLEKDEKVEYEFFMEGVPTKRITKKEKMPEDFRNY